VELFTILDRVMAPHPPVGGDIVQESIDRGWVHEFAPGQYVYGPEWTGLVRALQELLLDRARGMGFKEWLFPRLIPRSAVEHFKLTQFAPELLLSVDGGGEILDPVQCLPLYHHFTGRHVPASSLPLMIVETMGGWTWRNEAPERLDGPIRAREFLRVEHVWMAPLAEAVRLRRRVRESVTSFLSDSLGLAVQLVVGEGCMDIQSIRETLAQASTEDEVPVLDIEIPLRSPNRPDAFENPEPGDFEEISGCTVEGRHHLEDFGTTSDVPDLATGCCGVGFNRLVVGFLYQHGFDARRWPIDVVHDWDVSRR
jgi:seryl-tRNA synthetase